MSSADTEPGRKPLVLVVEDDGLSQIYIATVLRRHGFEALLAADADETRAQLAAHPDIEVILMDLSLSTAQDGLQLTRRLRGDARWKNVPIIATTAHALLEDRRAAMDAGCTAYLSKPISPAVLIAAVSRARNGAALSEPRES